MIVRMCDPLDESIIYSNHNTIFVAIHNEVIRKDLLNLLKPYRLKVYVANRRPDSIIKDFDIPCLARFIDLEYLSEIGEWLIDHLNAEGDNIPHMVLGFCHDERLRHPNLHYLGDLSDSDTLSLMNNMVREADKLFDEENPTPQTKEFVVTSIHGEDTMKLIKKFVGAMEVGIIETNVDDDYFDATIFNDAFIRIIDVKTLEHAEGKIKEYLERDVNTASFLVVGLNAPLPFAHPRLLRYQDVTSEWIANEIAKGQAWDNQECERYRLSMLGAR
jgi:hypothetical protein